MRSNQLSSSLAALASTNPKVEPLEERRLLSIAPTTAGLNERTMRPLHALAEPRVAHVAPYNIQFTIESAAAVPPSNIQFAIESVAIAGSSAFAAVITFDDASNPSWKYSIAWSDDGSRTTGMASSAAIPVTHLFSNPGAFIARVDITGMENGLTGEKLEPIFVLATDPRIFPGTNKTLRAGNSILKKTDARAPAPDRTTWSTETIPGFLFAPR